MNYEKEKKDTEPRDKWEEKKRRKKARLQDFRKNKEDRDEAEGRDTRLHCAFRF